MAGEIAPGVTHIDTAAVQALGDRLVSSGEELRAGAAGDLRVPAVPHDAHGLRGLIGGLLDAHKTFDTRLGDVLDGAGERAILQVFDATLADRRLPFLPLPGSIR
jgi:hypothetical protein